MEPFSAFHSYATLQIDETTKVRRNTLIHLEQASDILALKSFSLSGRVLPSSPTFRDFLYKIPPVEIINVQELIDKTALPINIVISLIMVGLKIGALMVERDPGPAEKI